MLSDMQAVKCRAVFTPEQDLLARKTAGCRRLVSNLALMQRQYTYQSQGWSQNYATQCQELADLKSAYPFLQEVPHHTLQQGLRDLQDTYADFFKGRCGYPKPKKKGDKDSFRFPDSTQFAVQRLSGKWGRAKLPKFGWVRFRWTRPVSGPVKNITVSRDCDDWYVSFCLATSPRPKYLSQAKTSVGLDRGVVNAVATSDGEFLDRHILSVGEQKRMIRLQQSLARQTKGSKRRARTKAAFGKLHRTARRRRQDFAHQTSATIVKNHDLVVLEDLRVKNMTRSAKGTLKKPGKNVAAKAALNQAILDKGWGQLRQYLAYKLEQEGGRLVLVSPAFSSQTCSIPECGFVDPASRRSQSLFVCSKCGHTENADTNAAKVILARGLKIVYAEGSSVSGQGDLHRSESMNCQPSALLAN